MSEYTVSSTMIPSYNDLVVVESENLTTASEQYWIDRQTACEEAIRTLTPSSAGVGLETRWNEICARTPAFLDRYLHLSVKSLAGPLRQLWGWHPTLIRKAQQAFLEYAHVEVWIPFSRSPLQFVRIPGSDSIYDIADNADYNGDDLELGKAVVAVAWQEDYFFLLLPSGAYVPLYSFTYTEDEVVWKTQEILPRAFAKELAAFQSELLAIEQAFGPLSEERNRQIQLIRAQQEHIRINKAAQAWRKLILPEETKQDLLRRMDMFEAGNLGVLQHLLLLGPSGTGTTLIARTIAETTTCDLQHLSLTDLKEPNIGASVQLVREVWAHAQRHQPSIIVVDRCDGVFPRRYEGTNDVIANDIVEAFLAEWNAVGDDARIWVVGVGNRREAIDTGILSLFGAEIELKLPSEDDRLRILRQELRELEITTEIPDDVITRTRGMSGRDLKHLASSIRMLAYPAEPTRDHFVEAIGTTRRLRNASAGEFVSWDSFALEASTIDLLKLISQLLRESETWRSKGVSVPRNLLFVGPSDVTARLIARVLAEESGAAFLAATKSDFAGIGYEGINRVNQFIADGLSGAPSVLFLETLESITPEVSPPMATDALEEELTSRLQRGIAPTGATDSRLFVVADTVHPERIDPRILRCFQETIPLSLPDRAARIRLATQILRNKKINFPMDDGTILLADLTEGRDLTRRDFESWIHGAEQRALTRAIRAGAPDDYVVTLDDFE